MNVLHISNSYGGTEVYTNLYKSIDGANLVQTVFVPLNANNHDRVGNKLISFKNKDSRIIYSTKLKSYHKFFYGLKIRAVVSEIRKTVDLSKVDIVHAGMLCFDGAIALELSKKYGIPYIVTVRNTDVNTYYKMLPWRHAYFTQILLHARKIVFISPKYKELFVSTHVPDSVKGIIEGKIEVIPNGVNQDFLNNINHEVHDISRKTKIIYVAAFNRGKGLIETIQAIDAIRKEGRDVELNAIGKGLPNRPQDETYVSEVERVANGKDWVKLSPFMRTKEVIEAMRASDIFVMVSSPETFGLVYVEALSQGLPIVYARNEGFDGFFPDGFVGYSAMAANVSDIQNKLRELIENYPQVRENINSLDLNKIFSWQSIGEKYIQIYNSIIK